MKIIYLLILFYSWSLFANPLNDELVDIQIEKQKIQNYLDSGVVDAELELELERLNARESELQASLKRQRKNTVVIQKNTSPVVEKIFIPEKAVPAKVQDELTVQYGALFDFYYLYSPGRSQEGTPLSNRNYDRKHNDFTLNLFQLSIDASFQKLSVYSELDFGDFADQNQAHSSDGINHHLGQAYLSYSFTDEFSVSVGKMYTHVGYEVAKTIDNWNTSRSFSFTLGGPFWHEGIAFKYAFKNGFNTGFFIYDNWDSSNENNREKTYGLQLGYSHDSFHLLLNAVRGPESVKVGNRKSVYEFNAQYSFNKDLNFAVNAVLGQDERTLTALSGLDNVDKKWSSWVVYLDWKFLPRWSISPRFEIFSDKTKDAAADQYIFSSMGATSANKLKSFTLTSSYILNKYSELRFELRRDNSDEKLWQTSKGEKKDYQDTISFSWLARI
jgi:hypothetical protein